MPASSVLCNVYAKEVEPVQTPSINQIFSATNNGFDFDTPLLDKPVGGTFNSMPLDIFIKKISTQSQINLELESDPILKEKRITARLAPMPVRKILVALTRMFGITWKKADGQKWIGKRAADELELRLLNMGDPKLLLTPEGSTSGILRGDLATRLIQNDAVTVEGAPKIDVGTLPTSIKIELAKVIRLSADRDLVQQFVLTAPSKLKTDFLVIKKARVQDRTGKVWIRISPSVVSQDGTTISSLQNFQVPVDN